MLAAMEIESEFRNLDAPTSALLSAISTITGFLEATLTSLILDDMEDVVLLAYRTSYCPRCWVANCHLADQLLPSS